MNNRTKVVVIAHKFPPFSGVGANRWGHLTFELAGLGHDITVLTVERGRVPDKYSNIDVRKLSSFGFYRFASYRFNHKLMNALYGKMIDFVRRLFWFDDEAQFWSRKLLSEIRALVNSHGKIVLIASGHPFQSNRWAAKAKKELGGSIFLIQDFRDPWAQNPFKKYLFCFQRRLVERWQNTAISLADRCVYVTHGLKEEMSSFPNVEKSVVIENGHAFSIAVPQLRGSDFIIHAGTLANGRDKIAEPFFKLCLKYPDVLAGRKVMFYGRLSYWLIKRYAILFRKGIFVLNDAISQPELERAYEMAFYALQFNAIEYPQLVSTKIYEHAAKNLPTLSINGGGEIDRIIHQYNIGESARPEEEAIKMAMEKISVTNYQLPLQYFANISSFKCRAMQYSRLIDASTQISRL